MRLYEKCVSQIIETRRASLRRMRLKQHRRAQGVSTRVRKIFRKGKHAVTLYRNKFRVESARLRGWDYSTNGFYFVTVCTRARDCVFGTVDQAKVILSNIGTIVNEEWSNCEQLRHNIKLDQWIIMPNHLHGIIIIENRIETKPFCLDESEIGDAFNASLPGQTNNLCHVIRGFKSASTRRIRQAGMDYLPGNHDIMII